MVWLMIVLGAIAAFVLVVLVVGSLLPKKHRAVVVKDVSAPPEAAWTAITDVQALPTWHPQVKSVELLAQGNAKVAWREIYKNGDVIPYETVSAEPPRRLVRRIADPKLPYGGTWTIEIDRAGSGSRVSITEDGEVYNPIFRFVSRFIMGHTATMERYLAALDEHLKHSSVGNARRQPA
jgi:uncharacterized protein YndB with AHSA1/START domain